MKKISVGIGEVLWDVFPQGKRLGGAPANFAWDMAQLGAESRLLSAVGCDREGREIVRILDRAALAGHIQRTDFPTGSVRVETDAAGIPAYEIRRDVAWDHIRFTPSEAALAASASCVCYGTLACRGEDSYATVGRFLRAMPPEAGRTGCSTSICGRIFIPDR